MGHLSVLERLRAYAAANPTDVQFVSEAVRQNAEIEAYRELSLLSRKWRRQNDTNRKLARLSSRDLVDSLLSRELGGSGDTRNPLSYTKTIPGMPAPRIRFHEEPFPLVNLRRLPAPPKTGLSSRSHGTRVQARPGWDALVRAVRCARQAQKTGGPRATG